jgi:hypothetical protein
MADELTDAMIARLMVGCQFKLYQGRLAEFVLHNDNLTDREG